MRRLSAAVSPGRIIGEFLLIVIGVLAALMVDTWIEERTEEKLAKQYLMRLADDLETDRKNLQQRILFLGQVREKSLETLAALERPDSFGTRDVVSAFYAAEIYTFFPFTNTYEDLQNTGNIRLLDDMELRLALVTYYARAQTNLEDPSTGYREIIRGVIPAQVQSAIRRSCPTTDERDDFPGRFPECELPDLTQEVADQVISSLGQYPLVSDILTYRVSEIEVRIFLQTVLLESLIEMQKSL